MAVVLSTAGRVPTRLRQDRNEPSACAVTANEASRRSAFCPASESAPAVSRPSIAGAFAVPETVADRSAGLTGWECRRVHLQLIEHGSVAVIVPPGRDCSRTREHGLGSRAAPPEPLAAGPSRIESAQRPPDLGPRIRRRDEVRVIVEAASGWRQPAVGRLDMDRIVRRSSMGPLQAGARADRTVLLGCTACPPAPSGS